MSSPDNNYKIDIDQLEGLPKSFSRGNVNGVPQSQAPAEESIFIQPANISGLNSQVKAVKSDSPLATLNEIELSERINEETKQDNLEIIPTSCRRRLDKNREISSENIKPIPRNRRRSLMMSPLSSSMYSSERGDIPIYGNFEESRRKFKEQVLTDVDFFKNRAAKIRSFKSQVASFENIQAQQGNQNSLIRSPRQRTCIFQNIDGNALETPYKASSTIEFYNILQDIVNQNRARNPKQYDLESSKAKLEKHMPVAGYTHEFVPYPDGDYDNLKALRSLRLGETEDYLCHVCREPFLKHQQSLIHYSSKHPKFKLKRQHSWHEHELEQMREKCSFEHDQLWRIHEANKKFMKNCQKSFTCDICYEELPIDNITFLDCGHYFCRGCLQQNYTYKIQTEGQVLNIKCPQASCSYKVTEANIKALVEPDSYKKFQKFLNNYQVTQSTDKKFCPMPNCEAVLKSNTAKTRCPSCKNDVCFKCQTKWHKGFTCDEAQKELYAGWAFKIGAHKCPNCKVPIEKNEGCSHMYCSKCSHSWCWVCGLPLNHWSHKVSKVLPLSCNHAPSTPCGWICHLLLFIFGFALIPLGIFFAFLGGCVYTLCRCCYRTSCIRSIRYRSGGNLGTYLLCCCLYLPFMTIWIAISLALGAILGVLAVALMTIPLISFHVFYFVRTCYWWCKTKGRIRD